MKIAILIAAALLGTAGIAATPAEAQRYGWNDRHDRGWNGDRGWRDDRGWRGDRGRRGWHDGRRGYRNDGWNRGRGRGGDRSRIVCRTYDSRYGPERRCVRIRR